MPVSGASSGRSFQAVSIDGSTYWASALSGKVMALDLQDERVACLDPPPTLVRTNARVQDETWWELTNVHACLGVTVRTKTGWRGVESSSHGGVCGTLSWTMESAGSRRRTLTHRGYVVSESWNRRWLYRNELLGGPADTNRKSGEQLRPLEVPELIMNGTYWSPTQIFAYVETLEPFRRSVRDLHRRT